MIIDKLTGEVIFSEDDDILGYFERILKKELTEWAQKESEKRKQEENDE